MIRCKVCGKKTDNKRCCSLSCAGKLGSKIGNLRSNIIQKKNKTGFWNSKLQSELGKRGGKAGSKACKRLRVGFYNPLHKIQSMGGKTTSILYPELANKFGKINGKLGGKMAHILHPMQAKIIGCKSAKILRNKKRIFFKGNYFGSYRECEIGMCVYYQIEKLIEGENYQFEVDSKSIDFFIKNTFIEFHQIIDFKHTGETIKDYYNKRRKLLNKNGYKNYPLLVIS